MKDKVSEILKQFNIAGDIAERREISSGHINDTYYVSAGSGEYIVQRINDQVFSDPDAVMHNIGLVTDHLSSGNIGEGRGMTLHYYDSSGKKYFVSGNDYWRVLDYLCNSFTVSDEQKDTHIIRKAGKAFAAFDRDLMDLDVKELKYVIPHFHHTPYIFGRLHEAAAADPYNRLKSAQKELDFITENEGCADIISKMAEEGDLPLRVTHNDMKLDNILFDCDTAEPLAVIDLDTCMPGLICYDYADAVRSGCCRSSEDKPEGMGIDMELFYAFTEGFMAEIRDSLTSNEIRSLSLCIPVVTLELASRFLEDYLRGDIYFRTEYEGQNLQRARAQIMLCKDIMNHFNEIEGYCLLK